MSEICAQIISELKIVGEDAQNKFGELTSEQINWRPSAEGWSVGQCFEHLIVTNKLYFPNIQKVINGEHRNNFFSKIPFSVDLVATLMRNALNPDQKRKTKTFKMFAPSVSNVSETVIEDFEENNQKLIEMIENVKKLDTHKIKIAEPLSVALNLRLRDAFDILLIHEKRHFRQAERVMKNEGFPH